MENPNITLAKRVGRFAACMTLAYIGLKVGENIAGKDLPFFIEMGVASGAATSIDVAWRRQRPGPDLGDSTAHGE